jgi:hypothetical protein
VPALRVALVAPLTLTCVAGAAAAARSPIDDCALAASLEASKGRA